MTIDDNIIYEKLQYDINREAAKISAASVAKIDKDEYLTGKEIMPLDQRRVIEQAKFANSPLREGFQKQIKTIEEHRKKEIEVLEVLKPEEDKEKIS